VRFLFFLLICSCITTGCFEATEACLDIEAANFDASADKSCCCTYPKLVMKCSHVYDTLTYLENEVYANDFGVFRLRNVVFYLCDFELTQNGITNTISDSIGFSVFGANAGDTTTNIITDDFLLIRRTTIEESIGTFRQKGYFDGIKFRFGLSTDANKIIPTKAPTNHALKPQTENLWLNRTDGYVFAKVIVAADTSATAQPDTLLFTAADFPNTFFQQTGASFFHKTGYDFKLTLQIDYKKLFEGVNWSATLPERKVKIRDNFSNVFSVYQ
jgi:hypothetical protein